MSPYEAAIEWIADREPGSTFTRLDFYVDLLSTHLFTARNKGSFNCALKNSSGLLVAVASNEWMRIG